LTAASRLPSYRQSRDPAITFDRDIAAKPGKPGENNLSFTRSNPGKKLNAARLVSDRASRINRHSASAHPLKNVQFHRHGHIHARRKAIAQKSGFSIRAVS
jgi:hypothetical protein